MTPDKATRSPNTMDARELPDWPGIHKAAALLAAEVIAEGGPSKRSRLPAGTKGLFGCVVPLALVSVYGLASQATGPTVAAIAGLLNYICCSISFSTGRFREFRAITRRVNGSVLMGRFSAYAAVSSMLLKAARLNPIDPNWVGLRAGWRSEGLPASPGILPDAVIVAERAIAGEAPLGQPVPLERPSPTHWALLLALPLVIGGVLTALSDALALPTIVMGVFGGILVLLAFDAGRYVELRDATDRLRGLAEEAAIASSPRATRSREREAPVQRRGIS